MEWWARREQETAAEWAERILCDFRTSAPIADAVKDARAAELLWLSNSMTADNIPYHLQALVFDRWLGVAHVQR